MIEPHFDPYQMWANRLTSGSIFRRLVAVYIKNIPISLVNTTLCTTIKLSNTMTTIYYQSSLTVHWKICLLYFWLWLAMSNFIVTRRTSHKQLWNVSERSHTYGIANRTYPNWELLNFSNRPDNSFKVQNQIRCCFQWLQLHSNDCNCNQGAGRNLCLLSLQIGTF